MTDAAEQFLSYVADHSAEAGETAWGPARCFDGHALAHLALRRDVGAGWRAFADTLDMIDANLAAEAADPAAKWHLADFALHPLLRAWATLRGAGLERGPDDHALWRRFEATVRGFRWHFGDLTENHNLLHAAGRHLAVAHGLAAPEVDGRGEVLRWVDGWAARGSVEWGADLYYNVDLLALLNLHDLSPDAAVRGSARAALDLIALDEATDAFAGAMCGAARRSYSCYRADARSSPSAPLHAVWFGRGWLNLNFVGGAVVAAVSDYRPPAAVVKIAGPPDGPFVAGATHLVGEFGWGPFPPDETDTPAEGHLSRHTWRSAGAMLGAMNAPGGRGRFTEQVFQATLGPDAVVFANHPAVGNDADGVKREADLPSAYAAMPPASGDDPRRYWTIGNAPPGVPGDLRPGYWQGNHYGPRSFGTGPMAMCVWRIGDDAQFPFVHAFFPRAAFDEVADAAGWTVARRDRGYVGLWLSGPAVWTTAGLWAGAEVRVDGPRVGLLCVVGDAAAHPTLDAFAASLAAVRPAWDAAALTLAATPPGGRRVTLDFERGPLDADGARIETRGPRVATPWGSMPLGGRRLELDVGGERHAIEVPRP